MPMMAPPCGAPCGGPPPKLQEWNRAGALTDMMLGAAPKLLGLSQTD